MGKLANQVAAAFDALNAKVADLELDAAIKNKLGSMTFRDAIAFQIASGINQWLHEKGDDVAKYQIFLDRVMDLKAVVELAIEKAEKTLTTGENNHGQETQI